jgi:hypothetical protein
MCSNSVAQYGFLRAKCCQLIDAMPTAKSQPIAVKFSQIYCATM